MKFLYSIMEKRWNALDLLITALYAALCYDVLIDVFAKGESLWNLALLALYGTFWTWVTFFNKSTLEPMSRDEAFDTIVNGVAQDPRDANALKIYQALTVAGFNGQKSLGVMHTIWDAQDEAWANEFKKSIGSSN